MVQAKRSIFTVAMASLLSAPAYSAAVSMEESTTIEASASLDVVSAYIFRGVTLNKNAAVQPGIEAAVGDFTIGTWGSLAMDAEDGEGEQEVDLYVGYSIALSDAVSVDLGAIEYMYPDSDIDSDREVSIALSVDTVLSPSIAANFGIEGAVEDTNYYELGLSQDLYAKGDFSSSLGLALGYLDPAEGEAGLSHAQLVASASYSIISASAITL